MLELISPATCTILQRFPGLSCLYSDLPHTPMDELVSYNIIVGRSNKDVPEISYSLTASRDAHRSVERAFLEA